MQINKRIPFRLSHRPTSATAGYDDPLGAYDFAIGGIPFRSGVSLELPLIRKSAQFKKDQFDNSPEPGEQSLTGWWLRSQSSFHGGMGLRYIDPQLDNSSEFRFEDAEGVDVWTPGQVTLLRSTGQVQQPISPGFDMLTVGAVVGGTDGVVYAQNVSAGLVTDAASYAFTFDTAPTEPFQAIASNGEAVYMGNAEGVWVAELPATPGAVQATKLWDWTAATVALGWVKGRLMGAVDGSVYELVPPEGAPPHPLPETPVHTSLVADWQWTGITAGPDAIYVSGYSGDRGAILRVQVDGEGALPVLSGATEVAQLPAGEWPLCIRSYLGLFTLIGTNRGVRIAEAGQSGTLLYGPLIETPAPVRDFASRDTYVYAPYSGGFSGGISGLLRIDLSLRFETGRFAHAKDLQTDAVGTVRSVALIGTSDRLALGLNSAGIYFESADELVPTGYVRTARIRYNTLWPKLYKRISVRGMLVGGLDIVSIDQAGVGVSIAQLDQGSDLNSDIAINYPDRPQEFLQVEFRLHRDTPTTGPEFRGYQMKALPAGPRPHQFIIPLLCFDVEKDRNGVTAGYPGHGLERLEAFEALESAGEVVLFEDLTNNRNALVTIEEYEFRQVAPQGYDGSRWGGILTVSLRTISP